MPSDLTIRPARADEAADLSALALRSKSHWGYDGAFLAACRDALTVSEQDCDSGAITLAERDGVVLGFYQVTGEPPHGVLDDLFVDLGAIGTGIGRLLLEHALTAAAARGLTDLTLESDPGAESFYARHGAIRIGETPSGVDPARALPRMRFTL